MLIPGQNQLAEPEIVAVDPFETILASIKETTVAYIATKDAAKAARVAETFANEAELATLLVEAFAVMLQAHERKWNYRIKQHLAWWATGSNLDARAADLGIVRQVLDPGDPNAFPAVPPTYESDDSLRLRYYLAPHAPAAGSRLHYRHEALTLSERATVSVEAPAAGQVVVTYTLDPDGFAAQVKDANGRRTAPGAVAVTVLSRAGDGTPSADLLQAVERHFARPDVIPETDAVTVQAATVIPYQIRARAWINAGPDAALTKAAAEAQLQAYAATRHALGGRIDPSWIDYTLHAAGAVRLEILEPLAPIVAQGHEAPYCTGVAVEVLTL